MRYLTLSADHQQFSLVDDASMVQVEQLGLSEHLLADLVAWNRRYQRVIVASLQERADDPLASVIDELDRTGMVLAERIAAASDDHTKVRYYSEGQLRTLP
jgi:hypothetical protein